MSDIIINQILEKAKTNPEIISETWAIQKRIDRELLSELLTKTERREGL